MRIDISPQTALRINLENGERMTMGLCSESSVPRRTLNLAARLEVSAEYY